MTKSAKELESLIRNSVGISTSIQFNPNHQSESLVVHSRDFGMEHPHGWEIAVERFDLHARFSFKFDDYAGELKSLYVSRLKEISESFAQQQKGLTAYGFEIKYLTSQGKVDFSDFMSNSGSSQFNLEAKFRAPVDEYESL